MIEYHRIDIWKSLDDLERQVYVDVFLRHAKVLFPPVDVELFEELAREHGRARVVAVLERWCRNPPPNPPDQRPSRCNVVAFHTLHLALELEWPELVQALACARLGGASDEERESYARKLARLRERLA